LGNIKVKRWLEIKNESHQENTCTLHQTCCKNATCFLRGRNKCSVIKKNYIGTELAEYSNEVQQREGDIDDKTSGYCR
jgi:hypothetical protein